MEVKEPAPKYFPKMSPSEFLEWERKQEYKHEYINGEVLAMSGASFNHNRIASNIIGIARPYLHGKNCDILPGDLRVSVKWRNSFFYPDVTIVCGEPEFDEDRIKDTLKNPAVIFEILSPSTEDYDIGRKQMYYMQISSLKQYIMIDAQKVDVRVITRREEKRTWRFDEYINVTDEIFIEPINLKIAVADLYEKIKF